MTALTVILLLVGCCLSVVEAAIPVKTKTIIGVGGSGTYDEIMNMPCSGGIAGLCVRQPKHVSGCLAPFDEEQSLKFRGPMDIQEIGVYYPTGTSWDRVSYFNQAGSMDNIVFMGNYGRSMDGHDVDEHACYTNPGETAPYIINGDDFMCHGYNTSYASPDGKCASKTPQHFSGKLDDDIEVNIMQAATCEAGGCGYYRGMGHRGWDGNAGSKLFAVKLKYTSGWMYDAPAMWFLHASVMRTANYGAEMCNCRGMGSAGGCGELDIAEVVKEQYRKSEVDTTIYSFKGAYSDQTAYKFERMVDQEVVYVTIFNQEGYIQILQLDSHEFSFDGILSNEFVDALNAKRELIMKMPGEAPVGCASPKCDYPYSQDGGFAARLEDGVVCHDAGAVDPLAAPETYAVTNPYSATDAASTTAPCLGADPYSTADPYSGADLYSTTDPYSNASPCSATDPYSGADPYLAADPNPSADAYSTAHAFSTTDAQSVTDAYASAVAYTPGRKLKFFS